MDVSVIIVNYNTKTITKNCIDSIFEKTKNVEFEVILVDNASDDGSKDFFEHDNRITYIYSPINNGFGAGNNIGMRNASGKYIFLLNSDTLLQNNAIKCFFDYEERHKGEIVSGCYLCGLDGTYRCSFFYFPAFSIKEFYKRHILKKKLKVDINFQEQTVEAISGANMFVPKSLIQKIGGFNENIFMYGEEGEWLWRMKKVGAICRLISSPRIIHLEGESIKNKNRLPIMLKSHFTVLKCNLPYYLYILARLYYVVCYGIKLCSSFYPKDSICLLKVLLNPISIDKYKSAPKIF